MAIRTGASGTYNISSENQYISGYVQWTETYDDSTYTTTNKSTVTQIAYLHRTNIYSGETTITNAPGQRTMYFGSESITDNSNITLTIQSNSSSSGGTYTEVYRASKEIVHDANGQKNIDLGFYMYNSLEGAAGNAFRVSRTTKNVNLTTIPRYATTTTTASQIKESSVKINWISDVAVDQVQYRLNNGSWINVESDVDKTSGTYTIENLESNTYYKIDFNYKRKDSQQWNYSAGYSNSQEIITLDYINYIKVNGIWKKAIPYININGIWKKAIPYINVNGSWKRGIN